MGSIFTLAQVPHGGRNTATRVRSRPDDNKLRVIKRPVAAVGGDGRKALQGIQPNATHPPYTVRMEEDEQGHVGIHWPCEDVVAARAEHAPKQITRM